MIASRVPDPDDPPGVDTTDSGGLPDSVAASTSAAGETSLDPPTPTVRLFALNRGPLAEHELIVAFGASAQDVSSALVLVPPSATLVEFGGDIDVSLIFREVPRPRAADHDTLPADDESPPDDQADPA
jgi:uncharacterized repeat protein (TIGR03917 family)